MIPDNFLDIDGISEAQVEQGDARLAFAKLYVETFVRNPAGAQLLAHWDSELLRKRVPVNATLNEYVATEAQRAFIQGILAEIKFAQSEGRLQRPV